MTAQTSEHCQACDAIWTEPLGLEPPKSAQEIERDRFEASADYALDRAKSDINNAGDALARETNPIALLELQHALDELADLAIAAKIQAGKRIAALARGAAA